jgi:glycosyltransferase involved in cell wall biosynthesis
LLISVVLPAYNAERFLAEALGSVFANQAMPLQVIVTDDGSTDATAAVAAKFPVTCLRSTHRGVAAARNLGWSHATGEFLAWLDADDRWPAGRLNRQLEVLLAETSTDVVYGRVQQFTNDERGEALLGAPRPARLPGSMLIRRAAFERVGGFDESLRVGEFMDWLVRSKRATLKESMIETVCLERRIHRENLGIVAREHRGDYLRVAARSLRSRESKR